MVTPRIGSIFGCLSLLLLLQPSFAVGQGNDGGSRETCYLRSSVIAAAGSIGTGSGVVSKGTLGQSTPAGVGTSIGYILHAGFWRSVPSASAIPEGLGNDVSVTELSQNRPNPFGASTLIQYRLAEEGPARLTIYDVTGRAVRTLVNGAASAGSYRVHWDGLDESGRVMPAGIYFCKLKTASASSLKKMVLFR